MRLKFSFFNSKRLHFFRKIQLREMFSKVTIPILFLSSSYLVPILFLSSSYLVPICFVSICNDIVMNMMSMAQVSAEYISKETD